VTQILNYESTTALQSLYLTKLLVQESNIIFGVLGKYANIFISELSFHRRFASETEGGNESRFSLLSRSDYYVLRWYSCMAQERALRNKVRSHDEITDIHI